jgi:hypothetical protein
VEGNLDQRLVGGTFVVIWKFSDWPKGPCLVDPMPGVARRQVIRRPDPLGPIRLSERAAQCEGGTDGRERAALKKVAWKLSPDCEVTVKVPRSVPVPCGPDRSSTDLFTRFGGVKSVRTWSGMIWRSL